MNKTICKPPYSYFEEERNDAFSRSAIIIWLLCGILTMLIAGIFFFGCTNPAYADEIPTTGKCTWYSVKSCLREGTSGICANGKPLNDSKYTCASWFYKFGTKLRVTNIKTGKSCIVTVTDRGPAKRLVRKQNKIIDLSVAAFRSIASLKAGVIEVEVTKL